MMNMDPDIRIGILGGSGLYEMEALTHCRDVSLDTPFGAPSGPYCVGRLDGIRVAEDRQFRKWPIDQQRTTDNIIFGNESP